MFFSTVVSYLPYTCITAFTPGPNNIVALYAVGQSGWRKGKNVILGIGAGFLCVMLLCAVLCYGLATYIPSLTGVLKYIGAAYILWLAIHIARSKPADEQGQSLSFWKAFLLQFANVKIIMYAITSYTAYVLPVSSDPFNLFLHAISFSVIGMAGIVTWAFMGRILQTFILRYHRPVNLVMAAVLVVCAIKLL